VQTGACDDARHHTLRRIDPFLLSWIPIPKMHRFSFAVASKREERSLGARPPTGGLYRITCASFSKGTSPPISEGNEKTRKPSEKKKALFLLLRSIRRHRTAADRV